MADLYKVNILKAPKGIKINDYIKEIYREANTEDEIEQAKDKIFRLTYKFGLDQLKLMHDRVTLEEGIGSMSLAFMKTFNNFDPSVEGASFINYYKMAIHSQVICDQLGKYRGSEESKEIFNKVENTMWSLDEPTEGKDGNSGTRGDIMPSGFDINEEVYYNILIKRILEIVEEHLAKDDKRKDPKLNLVFMDYINGHIYGGNNKREYLAEKYGISESQVKGFIYRQRKKLRLRLIEEGYYEDR